jgi:hypothetical protein
MWVMLPDEPQQHGRSNNRNVRYNFGTFGSGNFVDFRARDTAKLFSVFPYLLCKLANRGPEVRYYHAKKRKLLAEW